MEYVIYKRDDFNFVWGIYSIQRNFVIYISNQKKLLAKYTINQIFDSDEVYTYTRDKLTLEEKEIKKRIQLFEGDNSIRILFTV